MDLSKALKKFGEMIIEHLAENICDATQKHVDDFAHRLPEWLGGDAEKKEIIDALEDVTKEIGVNVAKHYLKIDIKKYLE